MNEWKFPRQPGGRPRNLLQPLHDFYVSAGVTFQQTPKKNYTDTRERVVQIRSRARDGMLVCSGGGGSVLCM